MKKSSKGPSVFAEQFGGVTKLSKKHMMQAKGGTMCKVTHSIFFLIIRDYTEHEDGGVGAVAGASR